MMGRSSDFKFWEEKLPIHYGDEGEFEVQRRVDDQVGVYSPPLWKRAPVDFRQETSSLLPHGHHYSCPSPTSRLRAIMDGRKELTEMIKNLPESSYELSLKDIVDDQQNTEDAQEREAALAEENKVKHKRGNRIPQRTKKTQSKHICRSASMESEVFLLKMFFPVSLVSKKKAQARKCSKICPGHSEGSEKPANKDWWKMIFQAIKENQKNTSIKRSTSDISSNRTREKKSNSRGQRGCLF